MNFDTREAEVKYYEEQASQDEFIKWYHQQEWPNYPKPSVTVDLVILRFDGKNLQVLLVQRKRNPWRNKYALIGGFLNPNEDILTAGIRACLEETNFKIDLQQIKQLPAWTAPERDPRGWIITNPCVIQLNFNQPVKVHAGDDAAKVQWFDINKLPELASDHEQILSYALETIRTRFELAGLDAIKCMLPTTFSMNQLKCLIDQVSQKDNIRNNLLRKYGDLLKEVSNNTPANVVKRGPKEKFYQFK